MARAAVKAKQAQKQQQSKARAKPHGRRRHASGGNPNQDLFFMRLRKRAKWIYVLLAVIFALTFAFVGVGSGSSGLDQLLSNLNIFGGSSGPSVSKAQKYIQDHPNAAKGYRDLATAYEGKGETAAAISALQQYTTIKRKDGKAWSELAGLQSTQAQSYLADYQNAYYAQQLAAPSQSFLPTGKLGTAVGSNPIESAQTQSLQTQVNDLQQRVQLAYNGASSSWEQVTKLQPRNSGAWLQLAQAAQTAGSTATAVKAYKKFLAIDPTSSNAQQIREILKQLAPPKK